METNLEPLTLKHLPAFGTETIPLLQGFIALAPVRNCRNFALMRIPLLRSNPAATVTLLNLNFISHSFEALIGLDGVVQASGFGVS